jgi:SAM-dependent methyltransferase
MTSEPSYLPPARDHFERWYERGRHEREAAPTVDHPYDGNAAWHNVARALADLVKREQLQAARVLEVGSGSGVMQDMVDRYVGIDLARSAAFFHHKPFGVASATRLPFADAAFDSVWSVWTIEHVDQPDEMLREMRRVVRPGGTVFLTAAFSVPAWVTTGLHKREFRDLTWRQRVTKASIPLRRSAPFMTASRLGARTVRLARGVGRTGSARLHYERLTPSFDTYWDYDADAVVSLDAYDVTLFFLSRGDQPVSREGWVRSLFRRSEPLIFRICAKKGPD